MLRYPGALLCHCCVLSDAEHVGQSPSLSAGGVGPVAHRPPMGAQRRPRQLCISADHPTWMHLWWPLEGGGWGWGGTAASAAPTKGGGATSVRGGPFHMLDPCPLHWLYPDPALALPGHQPQIRLSPKPHPGSSPLSTCDVTPTLP